MTEWVVHKYFMHGSKSISLAKHHWNHHEHTLDDMTLHKDDTYHENKNKYLGLYFLWPYSIAVFSVAMTEAVILNLSLKPFRMNIPWVSAVLWVALFGLYQSSFWNTLHPDIHEVNLQLSWAEGVPGWDGWKRLFSFFSCYDWMKHNHILHHLRKGERKGNFNVTLPGADYLFGTLYSNVEQE